MTRVMRAILQVFGASMTNSNPARELAVGSLEYSTRRRQSGTGFFRFDQVVRTNPAGFNWLEGRTWKCWAIQYLLTSMFTGCPREADGPLRSLLGDQP